jgi:hypothetical protein
MSLPLTALPGNDRSGVSESADSAASTSDMGLVYVLCPSYHGATLLSLLLNNHPQVLALGDTIPTRSFDQLCLCKKTISECDFWREALEAARAERFAGESRFLPPLPRLAAGARTNLVANLALASLAAARPLRRIVRSLAPVSAYLDAYESFHRVTLRRAGARVFVDGQKSWPIPLVVRGLTGRALSVLHLTRDPRAFAYSMLQRKRGTPEEVAKGWAREHRLMAITGRIASRGRYLQVRYEDLARSPRDTMAAIFAFLGLANVDVVRPPVDGEKGHVIGNKMKKTFEGTIELDVRWKDGLAAADARRIVRTSAAMMERLGYQP